MQPILELNYYQLSKKKCTQLILPSENYDGGGGGGDGDTTQGVGGRRESGELQEDGQLESSGGIRLRLRSLMAATKTLDRKKKKSNESYRPEI